MATQGNSTSHGNTLDNVSYATLVSDDTYTVIQNSVNATDLTLNYITTATGGTASDFGDLANGALYCTGSSDHTYGYFAGGTTDTDGIQIITIASPGNASVHGQLGQGAYFNSGTSGSSS